MAVWVSSLKPLHKSTVGEGIWPITARHHRAYMENSCLNEARYIGL